MDNFASFLRARLPGPALEDSVPILWSCFLFFGYFPFSKHSSTLDYVAFKRAVALLGGDGIEALRGNEERICDKGKPDETIESCNDHQVRLIFQSLAEPRIQRPQTDSGALDSDEEDLRKPNLENLRLGGTTPQEEDIIDILYLGVPHDACITPPHKDRPLPHAQRLACHTQQRDSVIPRQDLFKLLRLLLSIRLSVTQHPDELPYAIPMSVMDTHSLDIYTEILLRRFSSNGESDICMSDFNRAVNDFMVKSPQ